MFDPHVIDKPGSLLFPNITNSNLNPTYPKFRFGTKKIIVQIQWFKSGHFILWAQCFMGSKACPYRLSSLLLKIPELS